MIQACSIGNSSEEGRLLQGLLDSSPEAHAELYERFAPRIQRFAVARLPEDPETAEDIAVQTVIQAAKDIRRFNPKRSTLSSWLYGIARRRIIKELRHKTRLKSVPASAQIRLESAPEMASGQDLSESVAARIDAQRRIAAVTQILSDMEMEVLILNCIDELSLREIGSIVGRSERAVHSLLHRARQKAREGLGKDEN